MNALPPPDKFRAYRARKKAAGLRQIRLWVPDVNTVAFRNALDAQIDWINVGGDERETLLFTETAAVETWTDPD